MTDPPHPAMSKPLALTPGPGQLGSEGLPAGLDMASGDIQGTPAVWGCFLSWKVGRVRSKGTCISHMVMNPRSAVGQAGPARASEGSDTLTGETGGGQARTQAARCKHQVPICLLTLLPAGCVTLGKRPALSVLQVSSSVNGE